ncbi:MAG: DUF2723 domain-containing protein [Oligoflexia bacterium]|nr:DUF2723 domain-containing protein [Oligoflexia bacterium]
MKKKNKNTKPAILAPPLKPPLSTLSTLPKLSLLALLLIIFIVYMITLHPSTGAGDTGEFVTVANYLGVHHPPGYPLYSILGHLFILIAGLLPGTGHEAVVINFSSAIYALATLGLFACLLHRHGIRPLLNLAITGVLAFSPLFWSYATVAEVFQLNNLLCMLLLVLTEKVLSNKQIQLPTILSGAFVGGLALSHHHTAVLLVIPCFIAVTLKIGAIFKQQPKLLFLAMFVFFLGLTPYALLPLHSSGIPLIYWGDQSTLEGFFHHFFRGEYGTWQLLAQGEATVTTPRLKQVYLFFYEFSRATLFLGVPLLLFLFIAGKRLKEHITPFITLLMISFLFYFSIFTLLSNNNLSHPVYYDLNLRFWILPQLLLFLIIPTLIQLTKRLPAIPLKFEKYFLLLPAIALALHFNECNQKSAPDYAGLYQATLERLPQNALVLSSGDVENNNFRYIQYVKNVRRDVVIIDRGTLYKSWSKSYVSKHFPSVTLPATTMGYAGLAQEYTLLELLKANSRNFPIFLSPMSHFEQVKKVEESVRAWAHLVAFGPLLQVIPLSVWNSNKLLTITTLASAFQFFDRLDEKYPITYTRKLSWDYAMADQYNQIKLSLCIEALNFLLANPPPDTALARKIITTSEHVIASFPTPPIDYHKMVAGALSILSPRDKPTIAKFLFHAKKYLNEGDPQAIDYPSYQKVYQHYNSL